MDRKTKAMIESFAWDCTVGAGHAPDECGEKKFKAACHVLAMNLRPTQHNRELTAEELNVFNSAWKQCVQEMQSP
jgi:hypothetical protein